MSKSKTMAFADFLERISTDEGKAKLDALIAQKILGKKVIARSGKFYREEPASEQHPKGGVYAIKKYTNSIEAAEDLIDHVTSTGHVVIARINNNHVMFNGEKSKAPKYDVSVQYVDENEKIQRIDQKGSKFGIHIVTIAALLRWKGILDAPIEKAQK